MVPIHDTDVAAERWSKSGWENYELWEKVEVRLKRQRRLWIAATVFVFISLSTVPIIMDRWPKWKARAIARHFAQELNQIKREAITSKSAIRIRFQSEGKLAYVVESLPKCGLMQGQLKRVGVLVDDSWIDSYVVLSSEKAQKLGIPGIVSEFCYDFLSGSDAAIRGESVVGFAFLPVNDLSVGRLDRLSVLLLTGASAEMSFD